MDLINQIMGGGWASIVAAGAGALVTWYAKQQIVKPTDKPADKPSVGGILGLLHPDAETFPILSWFAQLPDEQRAKFFEAIRAKAGK